jgi:hypothetical protein
MLYVVISALPIFAAFIFVQLAEPFPHGWLQTSNPHYWPNLLRSFTFLLGGGIIGMVVYTMVQAIGAESSVTGGHPRVVLYRYVSVIAGSHGMLMLTLMFYVRERINAPLSPATPFALAGMLATVYALLLMLKYQNSRLRRFHTAKQVYGMLEHRPGDRSTLCMHVYGSPEPMSFDDFVAGYDTGELVRLTVEKVEELPEGTGRWWGHRVRVK